MRSQTALLAAASLEICILAQTSTIIVPCLSQGFSLYSALPTPANSDLTNFFATWASSNPAEAATSPCAVATALPSSLSADASSYQAQVSSFVGAHAADISSVVSVCDALPATATASGVTFQPSVATNIVHLITAIADPSCFGTAAQTTGAPPPGDAGANASANAGMGNSTDTRNAALARPTGVMAGAAAAAAVGLIGVVVLL